MYPVNDIFDSIQGEGYFMGYPATFIRLQGCPVKCEWCDTMDSWGKGGKRMSAAGIASQVNHKHVVITGGEPLIHNLDNLIEEIGVQHTCFMQVETCGAFEWKGVQRPDFVTVSPKKQMKFVVGIPCDEVKFVVDEWFTVTIALGVMEQVPNAEIYSFMPEGCPPSAEMRKKAYDMVMKFNGNPAMYSDRLQYILGVK